MSKKNKLIDLNDHLFCQMERLSDEELTPEQLQVEVVRAQSIRGIAGAIIENARLALDAHKALNDGHLKSAPEMLGMEVPTDEDK